MLQAFGRTALYLSGGGPFGFYHFGVVSCLLEERLLPQVLCGTATGALVAALLAVHSSEEMGLLLKSEALCLAPYYLFDDKCSIKKKLVKFLTQDHVVNIEELKEFCIQHLGQFTFEEAYQKTGRAVNIVALPRATWEVPLLLNHLTSPHVLLWSAVLSSCSLFELCPAVDLYAKNYVGTTVLWSSLRPTRAKCSELPMKRIVELFNVNQFITSQVDPYAFPFLYDYCRGVPDHSLLQTCVTSLKSFAASEIRHRAIQASILVPDLARCFPVLSSLKCMGDILIVPKLTLKQMLSVLTSSNQNFYKYSLEQGARATWPCVSQIRACIETELTLIEVLKKT
ncbi:uncharacterized protein LOC135121771 isoform X2 [Zophobas morio]|uniref:uncharacterized protein LOC135121771 isoform X2 n=1 Tax=Zophobas morio TaxID=2755281 RepID=UPI0030830A98